MHKIISFLLVVIFVFQGTFPALAVLSSIDEITPHEGFLKAGGILSASRDFASDSDTTGAGCLPVAHHEGEAKVFLGLRDDTLGWCNVGGQSDKDDITLNETASRESSEETFGLYAIHKRVLGRGFSHSLFNPRATLESEKSSPDFLSKKKNPHILLYRMFIMPVEYIPASVFKKKLEGATEAHHKEYTEFAWVSLKDFLDVIQGKCLFSSILPQELFSEENRELLSQTELFEPFLKMLKAPPVFEKLNDLLQKRSQTTSFSFERERHTLSFAREDDGVPIQSTYVKWEPVSLEENKDALNFLAPQKPLTRTVFLGKLPSAQTLFATSTDEDLEKGVIWGTTKQKFFYSERQSSPEKILHQETVPFNSKEALNSFIETYAAKVQLNFEFKKEMNRRAQKKYEGAQKASELSIVSTRETATEAHLRLWLGESYRPGKHKENIRALIEKVGLKEELRREAKLTEDALDILSKVLDKNHEIENHPRLQQMPFRYEAYYHGCRQEMITLYLAFSILENFFCLKDNGEFSALRGSFSYVDRYKEMTKTLGRVDNLK